MRRRTIPIIVRQISLTAGLALLAWWLVRRYLESEEKRVTEYPIPPAAEKPVSREPRTAPRTGTATTQSDDLKRIAGIGPKIANVLADAGVVSFAQLAAAEVNELSQMLADGGVRIAYPDTWPEQAALAAAGEWDALENLQSQLVRGRRVERKG